MGKDISHNCNFLLCGIASHRAENYLILRGYCPCGHCQAELDVSFDFSGMESTVEKSEFYSPFGEVAVEVDSVIAGAVIVLMVNTATISVICAAIPNLFCLFLGDIFVFFHFIKES